MLGQQRARALRRARAQQDQQQVAQSGRRRAARRGAGAWPRGQQAAQRGRGRLWVAARRGHRPVVLGHLRQGCLRAARRQWPAGRAWAHVLALTPGAALCGGPKLQRSGR